MKIERQKQQIIVEYLSGDISLPKFAFKYDYDHNVIYKWILAYQRENRKGRLLNPGAILKNTLPEAEPAPEDISISWDIKRLQEELRLSKIRVLLLEATKI